VSIREFFLENFAGDLEYHPRRAMVYLGLAIAAACYWFLSAHDLKFTAMPLIFALGGLTLATKGVFLLKKSSEGLGHSEQRMIHTPAKTEGKRLDTLPAQAAQIVQDFGAGPLLLWPLLNMTKDIDPSSVEAPRLTIFISGAVLFAFGWVIRRFATAAV
jgi:hypothetical protein